ncbi:MAG: peptide deformylase [Rhabdochlamydiaceae bacterium]|nr:peptide deformylase [Rhabdochlamydiaceae bacterium]
MSHFLPPHDPRLNEPSLEVTQEELSSKEMQDLIEQMYTIAGGERGAPENRGLVGLAAPQIGVFKRVIIVDIGVDTKRTAWGKLKAYINPRIVASSPELALDREGCFSVDSHVCGVVPRSKQITIMAWDPEGNLIEETHSDYTARIFQHEIDHLDGKRFPDCVGEHGKLHWVELDEYPEYRLQWQNWPRLFLLENWIAMKKGTYTKAPE